MDYEKKKRLVELRDSMKSYGYMDGVEELEDIFPELKKSEDERIRKWLYDYISNCPNNNFAFYGGVGKDAVLNYLEKQKPAEWSEEDEDTLGDAICAADILGNDESFNKGNPHLAKAFRVAKDWLKELPERFNPHPKQEWSEEDEKMLKAFLHKVEVCDLLTNKENVWIVKKLKSLHP